MDKHSILEWHEKLMPALESKQSEFKIMGYKDITTNDIWNCLIEKVWKKDEQMNLHQVVQDILHLPTSVYMSYLALSAYHVDNDDLMKSIQAVTKNEVAN